MKRAFTSSKFIALALALLVAVVLIPVAAFGQAISGDMVGTVTDKSGAVVAGAAVVVTNEATGVKAATTTNGSGEFRFSNLLVGSYSINASAKGFSASTMTGFPVDLNKTATAKVVLEVGGSSTTVEVSAGLPPIDTTTATIETQYQGRETQDLAVAAQGLGVLNLSLLQAGVGSSGGLGAGTGPAVGGQRPRNNNFTVEGVDNNDKGVTGPLIYVPNDAVANFAILQNQFSPEFGHSSGGQFNIVTVSGTNNWHGRAYEYFQNRNLNAVDTSLQLQGVTENPRYDNNRFGGQVGGPIIKNKLFFFVNYEYNPIGQATSQSSAIYAPTAAGYAQLLAVPGVSASNIAGLQAQVQAPSNDPTHTTGVYDYVTDPLNPVFHQIDNGIVPIVAPNYQNNAALITSLDYNISDRDQLRGRFIWNKQTLIDNLATLPQFYTNLVLPYDLVSISEYHTFSPTITNEFRLGYNRYGYNYVVPGGDLATFENLDQYPNLTIGDLGGINVGPDPNAPQYSQQNMYQAVDNLTWVKGNHTLKFGIEGRKYISPQLFIQRSRGDYDWESSTGCTNSGGLCGGGLDAFANDFQPDFAERSFGSVGYSGDQSALYWYVNDTWKIRSNVSINLGIRYEYTTTPYGWTQQQLNNVADVPGVISFDSPSAPKNNFAPRVGFAWSPGHSGNTSIRAGFGMGYDVLYDNIGVLSRPPQIGNTVDCPNTCSAQGFLANGGIPFQATSGITVLDPATARANTSTFLPNNVQYPYSEQWNLGIQHVFATNYTLDVRYVGTRGIKLNVQNRINVQDVVNQSNGLPTYINAPTQAELDSLPNSLDGPNGLLFAPVTGYYSYGFFVPRFLNNGFYSEIVAFEPWGASTYHGLQTQLNRRFSNGLQFQVAYTYSHTIDNSTADFFSTVISPRRPQDFQNLNDERSSSVIDHRHRFTAAAIYDVPWYTKDSNWMKKNLLGNWEIAPVYTYETGQWGSLQSGVDANLNTDNAGDRVIVNPNGQANLGTTESPLTNSDGFTVAYLADNPNARYIQAQFGALPDVGRNTIRTPAINNWDLSILKRFNATERYSFEIFGQFLNAFNHPQYTTGSINQVNSISTSSGGARNYLIPGSSNFLDAKQTFISNARTTQLGVKFIF